MPQYNRPLTALNQTFIRKYIKAVTFDIDGVVVPVGTKIIEDGSGTHLSIRTHRMSARMVNMIHTLKRHVWINFSSGRSLLYLQHFLGDVLWDKVSLCGENGNFVFMNGAVKQLVSYPKGYFQKLSDIRKDLQKLKVQKPKLIVGFEPKHVILTVFTRGEVPLIAKTVKRHDREGELYCLWSGEGYDIGYKKTSKATALKYICENLGIKSKEMVTTGNNLNDREMLSFGIGVSVDPERVRGAYAIPKKRGMLGGEVLAEYLLNAFRKR